MLVPEQHTDEKKKSAKTFMMWNLLAQTESETVNSKRAPAHEIRAEYFWAWISVRSEQQLAFVCHWVFRCFVSRFVRIFITCLHYTRSRTHTNGNAIFLFYRFWFFSRTEVPPLPLYGTLIPDEYSKPFWDSIESLASWCISHYSRGWWRFST